MTFFDRCWQLKIQLHNGRTHVYQKLTREDVGLAVSFRCDAKVNGVPPSGDLTITGLPDDTISYLGTNYEAGSGALKPSFVEFSAGYDGNLSLLIVGNIYQSNMNYTQPDHSINLKIMTCLEGNQENVYASVSLGGNTTLRDVVANLCNKLKLSLDMDKTLTNVVIGDYSYQGSPMKQLQQLRGQHPDIDFTVGKNKLMVYYKATKAPQVKYKLTSTSGLLGTPQPTPQGIIINTYLLSNLYVHDFIELEARHLPQMNGVYKITGISHQGDSRGNTWKSQLTCFRSQLF